MSEWSVKNPYPAEISENFILNGEGSRKETRHIVFKLGDSGLDYKAGDALAVVPICPPSLVDSLLETANLSGEEEVETHQGTCTLREALTHKYEIHRVSKKWIKSLENKINSSSSPIEIQIISRQRVSTVDGSVMIDWDLSESDSEIPSDYEVIESQSDSSTALWNDLV